MGSSSEIERKQRADRLRAQIDSLNKPKPKEPAPADSPAPESPAQFIHRKMQEPDSTKR